jgi:hypothetical protein
LFPQPPPPSSNSKYFELGILTQETALDAINKIIQGKKFDEIAYKKEIEDEFIKKIHEAQSKKDYFKITQILNEIKCSGEKALIRKKVFMRPEFEQTRTWSMLSFSLLVAWLVPGSVS